MDITALCDLAAWASGAEIRSDLQLRAAGSKPEFKPKVNGMSVGEMVATGLHMDRWLSWAEKCASSQVKKVFFEGPSGWNIH